jgi:hypothetical protein
VALLGLLYCAEHRVAADNDQGGDAMTFVAGKRCKPILLYVILVVVALSLAYFCVHHGSGGVLPQDAPLHQN